MMIPVIQAAAKAAYFREQPGRVACFISLLAAASAPCTAADAAAPSRIPLYAQPHPVVELAASEKPPLDPRGKPLFRPNPSGPPLGHHWVKVSEKIGFWIGMRIEPAYAREENGIEIYVVKDVEGMDADGYPIGGVAVDPVHNAGDTANVTAVYQLLAGNDPQGKVIAQKNLGRIGQNHFDGPEMGYFVTEFIPNPAGRYAIVFGGEINGVKVSNRTVCAYEDEEVHTFSCVQTRTPSVF